MAEMIPADQGRVVIVAVPQPAAGANWTYTQPDRVRWWVKSIALVFDADSNVAERFPVIAVFDGLNNVLEMIPRDSIAADELFSVQYYPGIYSPTGTGRDTLSGFMPPRLILNGGVEFRSRTLNIQAGDQYSQIYMIVEEWIEPLA